MRLVLLVGTGRCGSTLLSNILNTHPEVLSISELFVSLRPDAFLPGVRDGDEMWEMMTRPRRVTSVMAQNGILPEEFLYPTATGRYEAAVVPPIAATTLPHLVKDSDQLLDELEPVVRAFPRDAMGVQYERLFLWLATRFDRRVVIERSGASLEYLPELYRAFPEAAFVHVVRDPLDCALSMRQHHVFRVDRIRSRLIKELGFDPYLDSSTDDCSNVSDELRQFLPSAFDREAYDSFPFTAEEFGWIWSALIMTGLPILKQLPRSRLHTVRYEDIIADPAPTIAALAHYLGLGDGDAWAAKASGLVRSHELGARVGEISEQSLSRLRRSVSIASRALRKLDRTSEAALQP